MTIIIRIDIGSRYATAMHADGLWYSQVRELEQYLRTIQELQTGYTPNIQEAALAAVRERMDREVIYESPEPQLVINDGDPEPVY